ncbi:MAG: DUF5615 family PIN-like protein [Planctomycetes bacterium]|nr:DUF5615 family PIN-like protein [Planctomycetota bacterium]
MTIRFHLDEHINEAVARGLHSRGIDATTSIEAGLLAKPDEEHLAFGMAQQRVIVTHDDDFLVLHDSGSQHAGICYCHPEKYNVGQLLRALLLVYDCLTDEDMVGHVEYL